MPNEGAYGVWWQRFLPSDHPYGMRGLLWESRFLPSVTSLRDAGIIMGVPISTERFIPMG